MAACIAGVVGLTRFLGGPDSGAVRRAAISGQRQRIGEVVIARCRSRGEGNPGSCEDYPVYCFHEFVVLGIRTPSAIGCIGTCRAKTPLNRLWLPVRRR